MAALDWAPNGAVVLAGGTEETVRFHVHAESGTRYYGLRQVADGLWELRLVIGQTLVWRAMCTSEDAARQRAQGWEGIEVSPGDRYFAIDVPESFNCAQRDDEAEFLLTNKHPNKQLRIRVSPVGLTTSTGQVRYDAAYVIPDWLSALPGVTVVYPKDN